MTKQFLIILAFFLCRPFVFSQNIDSLKQALKTAKHDTAKVKLYVELSDYCEPNEIPNFANPAIKLCEENLKKLSSKNPLYIYYLKKLATAYNNIGFLARQQGDITKALDYFQKSLDARKSVKDDDGIGSSYNNIAAIYNDQGDIPMALDYYHKSLKIRESINDKQGISISLSNIGLIYNNQGNITKALSYYNRSLKIQEEINDKEGIAYSLNNIGGIYKDQADLLVKTKSNSVESKLLFQKALDYCLKSLAIQEEIQDERGIAYSLGNIGTLYSNQAKLSIKSGTYNYEGNALLDKSLDYYKKSLHIFEIIQDKRGIAHTLNIIAGSMLKINKIKDAKSYGEHSLQIAKELGYPDCIQNASETLSKIYSMTGNWKAAYEMQVLFKQMSDSIDNEINKKASIQKGFQYEYDKKTAADSIKTLEVKKISQAKLAASEASLKQEKTQRFALYGGLALVIVFAGFMFNRFKITQKQKNIIEIKEKETQHQKRIIEEKHKEITDSINYAERIQRSFLASDELLNDNLKNYFILFKPKDIVSGDFYWASKLSNANFIFVTADSTGHGVPGAIMSLLNITSLEKAIEQHTDPAQILNHTRNTIIERLKKDGSAEGGKDGMDCSLLVFDFNKKQLHIAAANNPVWIVRNNALIEIKTDKMPVGKSDKEMVSFTSHTIELQKRDIIYALTDGFPDQFGGEKGKKFMSKKLKELLLANSHLPLPQQKDVLETTFKNWVGNLEQVDDVCVIGIRV